MLLKALENKGLSLQDVADRMGISITSARLYVQKSRIPRRKRWNQLAQILGIDLKDLEQYYHGILEDQGLLKHCKSCNKGFVARFEKTQFCSRKCRDKSRIPSMGNRMDTTIPKIREESRDEKDQIRELIRAKTDEYLSKGLTIEKLPEQPRFKFDYDEY